VLFICGWEVIIISIFFHHNLFIKRVLSLEFYKTNFWGVQVLKSFTKTKTQFIKLYYIFEFLQHSYKSFNTISLIKMTLHKYVWNFWQFFGHLTWFLVHVIVIAFNHFVLCLCLMLMGHLVTQGFGLLHILVSNASKVWQCEVRWLL
jgi:hypothetical protein